MKIIVAADGSKYTKKALAFLVNHEGLAGAEDELFVLNVQLPVRSRVKIARALMGSAAQRVVTDSEVPVLLVK